MRIRKAYYVIYEGNKLLDFGITNGRIIETSLVAAAEFDTEAEMLQFIADNELEEAE